MTNRPDIRVIGIGSSHGADAAGWLACELLQAHTTLSRIDWQLCRSPMQLPELVENYTAVVVLDAVISSQPSGQVISIIWPQQQQVYHSLYSSHGLGVVEALQLASTLGQLPASTYILGISFNEQQQDAGPVVKQALPHIQQELEYLQNTLAS